MTNDALRAQLRTFIAENFVFADESTIANDASLLDSGLIDSTGAIELITHVESLVGRTFADDDLVASNFDSIDRIVSFLARTAG
ncbi:MAG: acyl carrier protein [Ilumatobacteraceae bacterium]